MHEVAFSLFVFPAFIAVTHINTHTALWVKDMGEHMS